VKRTALLLVPFLLAFSLRGAEIRPPAPIERSAELDDLLSRVAADAVAEFGAKGLAADGISISVIDLSERDFGAALAAGSWRGDAVHYPASVVKAFYLAHYASQKEAGKLSDTPELVRAVKDMITVSSNDATGLVVDVITGTTSGPEIASAREWKKWTERRNAVNRFFASRGYRDLNASQKTFCEDAYGREQNFRDGGRNRNRMTSDGVARLFKEIARGEIAGPAGTQEMLGLLSRDITPETPFEDVELEDARLAGKKLPPGARLWSKAGSAYDAHHLVSRVALGNGADFVIAVFTKGVKDDPEVIPRVYEKVGAHFAATPGR
jgi:hypothetical protein